MTEGVSQAKDYANNLQLRYTFATNGRGIYGIDMETGHEGEVPSFPSPDELWNKTFAIANQWRDRFASIPFEDCGGYFQGRYYQDIAIERALNAISEGNDRILLTLATGTNNSMSDAVADLGKAEDISRILAGFQKFLYQGGL